MKTKDIYSGTETTVLRADAGKVIGDAIKATGMSVKDFSASIGEKELTINKIINGSLVPDDKIIAKLEKTLGVKVYEAVESAAVYSKGQSGGMTLGSFIKTEKKRSPSEDLLLGLLLEARYVYPGLLEDRHARNRGREAELFGQGPGLFGEFPRIHAVARCDGDEFAEHVLFLLIRSGGRRRSGSGRCGHVNPEKRFGAGLQLRGGGIVERHLEARRVYRRADESVAEFDAAVLDQHFYQSGSGLGGHPLHIQEYAYRELLHGDKVLPQGTEEGRRTDL